MLQFYFQQEGPGIGLALRVQNLKVKSVMNVAHSFYIKYHQIFTEGFGNLCSIFVRQWKKKTQVLKTYSNRAHAQRC
jgi:hypothetical protein